MGRFRKLWVELCQADADPTDKVCLRGDEAWANQNCTAKAGDCKGGHQFWFSFISNHIVQDTSSHRLMKSWNFSPEAFEPLLEVNSLTLILVHLLFLGYITSHLQLFSKPFICSCFQPSGSYSSSFQPSCFQPSGSYSFSFQPSSIKRPSFQPSHTLAGCSWNSTTRPLQPRDAWSAPPHSTQLTVRQLQRWGEWGHCQHEWRV